MNTTLIHEFEAGQSMRLVLRRGDRLWLRGGGLLAEPPVQWLGDRLWCRSERWPEGRCWTAAETGPWQCRALQPTTLVLERRVRWAGLRAWLRSLAGRFSGSAAPAPRPPAAPRPRPSAAAARCAGTPVR